LSRPVKADSDAIKGVRGEGSDGELQYLVDKLAEIPISWGSSVDLYPLQPANSLELRESNE
jgi:hypothetical protein